MRMKSLGLGCLAVLAGLYIGCSSDDDEGGGTDVAAETTPETTPSGATWDDIYPIYAASCGPCHSSGSPDGGPSGGHSIASTDRAVAYQASQRAATAAQCSGLTVGECGLVRIQDGSMPANGACQDPKTDQCPDAGQQALIQAWIDAGMPEN